MKKNNQTLIIILQIIILIFFLGCSSYSYTPLYNNDCPFRQLNFTTAIEKDSLRKTVSINDSLVVSLKSDLEELKTNGKVGNNLSITINKLKTASSTKELDVTNEYYQLFNNKTTALCGLNDLLRNNKKLRSPKNREKAENLLLKLIEDLSTFGDKKKELLDLN